MLVLEMSTVVVLSIVDVTLEVMTMVVIALADSGTNTDVDVKLRVIVSALSICGPGTNVVLVTID